MVVSVLLVVACVFLGASGQAVSPCVYAGNQCLATDDYKQELHAEVFAAIECVTAATEGACEGTRPSGVVCELRTTQVPQVPEYCFWQQAAITTAAAFSSLMNSCLAASEAECSAESTCAWNAAQAVCGPRLNSLFASLSGSDTAAVQQAIAIDQTLTDTCAAASGSQAACAQASSALARQFNTSAVDSDVTQDAPQAAAPAANAPIADVPIADAPLAEAPLADPPLASAPITDAPIADAPIADAPIADGPIADAPIADAPIADAPIADAPIADGPIADAPIADAPIADAPLAAAPAPAPSSAAVVLEPEETGAVEERALAPSGDDAVAGDSPAPAPATVNVTGDARRSSSTGVLHTVAGVLLLAAMLL